MNDYRQEEWLTNIPLYAVEHLILKINAWIITGLF